VLCEYSKFWIESIISIRFNWSL